MTFSTGRRYDPTCHSLCRAFHLLAKNRVHKPALHWLCGSGSSFGYSLQLVGKYPPAWWEDSPSISDNFAARYGFESNQKIIFLHLGLRHLFFYARGSKHKIWQPFYIHWIFYISRPFHDEHYVVMKSDYMKVFGKRFFIHSSYHQSFFAKKGQSCKSRPYLSVCLRVRKLVPATESFVRFSWNSA